MPNVKKIQRVSSLVEKLKQSPNFVLFHFANTPHQKMEELRKKLHQASSKIQVVKNILFKIAANKLKKKELTSDEVLKGQSALLTLLGDWSKGMATFYKFAKTDGSLSFKIGIIEGKIYQKDELERLAQLPSREELVSKIITSLKSPQTRIIYSMRFGMLKLVNVLKAKGVKENG